jgi:hypothetical protein
MTEYDAYQVKEWLLLRVTAIQQLLELYDKYVYRILIDLT